MTELRFVAWQRPALPAGRYSVRVGQRLDIAGLDQAFGDVSAGAPLGGASLRFASHGPRVSLAPSAVVGRFPPPGSSGHDAEVLPHVLLEDASLPWLRAGGPQARPGKAGIVTGGDPAPPPWLALVVFGGDEIDRLVRTTLTAGALGLDDEPGQRADEPATVIGIPAELARSVLPRLADLPVLAHVRETTDPASLTSVVVGNRPVLAGVRNEVHLFSVEGVDLDAATGHGTSTVDPVELISLASWSFTSLDDGPGFAELAFALAHNAAPLRQRTGDPLADTYLLRGVLPFRHGDGLSFYRGPLAPVRNDPVAQRLFDTFDNRLPERADELILHDEVVAMDDVTYAVAFDLGRSLMLRETAIALAVADHRRAARLAAHARGQLHGLTDHKLAPVDAPPPATVTAWMKALVRLELVPDRYLLPDPDRLVPLREASWTAHGRTGTAPGSLAWFTVDPRWASAAALGALSVGPVSDRGSRPLDDFEAVPEPLCGFVLRSPLVRWDDLEILVYPAGLGELAGVEPIPHTERSLGADLRLVVFAQPPGRSTVEIGRRPDGVHFGTDHLTGDAAGAFAAAGQQTDRLDVAGLAHALGATDAATFARAMVQGSPRIRLELDHDERGDGMAT